MGFQQILVWMGELSMAHTKTIDNQSIHCEIATHGDTTVCHPTDDIGLWSNSRMFCKMDIIIKITLEIEILFQRFVAGYFTFNFSALVFRCSLFLSASFCFLSISISGVKGLGIWKNVLIIQNWGNLRNTFFNLVMRKSQTGISWTLGFEICVTHFRLQKAARHNNYYTHSNVFSGVINIFKSRLYVSRSKARIAINIITEAFIAFCLKCS